MKQTLNQLHIMENSLIKLPISLYNTSFTYNDNGKEEITVSDLVDSIFKTL